LGNGDQNQPGKADDRRPFDTFIPEQLALNSIGLLSITLAHTAAVSTLSFHHRDPFDRLLIAQSLVDAVPIVSRDGVLDAYGVVRMW
jgi:PIN domain nuclease of toxin-antitoxin system